MNEKKLEKTVKGFANHWRIKILVFLDKNPGSILDNISEYTNGNFKTIAVHVSKLNQTGLVWKEYRGRTVLHSLTPLGKNVLTFLRKLER